MVKDLLFLSFHANYAHVQDVVMTHSASGALLLSLEVLCEPGSSILVPSPGFSLYKCHAHARGVSIKTYKLQVSI